MESEDDFNGNIENIDFAKMMNNNKSTNTEADSGSESNDVFQTQRPHHYSGASNKSNKSSKSITFFEAQDTGNHNRNQSKSSNNNVFQKNIHRKNKESQHSIHSSKSGGDNVFGDIHNAKSKSVEFSLDNKDNADTSDNENVNNNANNNNNDNDNNDNADNNESVNASEEKNDEIYKTLEELCDILGEMDARISVIEQVLPNNNIITFCVASNVSLQRQKSMGGTVSFADWSGFDTINKDSNLLYEDSFFDEGFLIEDSFVMVKFDFEGVPHLRTRWDEIFDKFGASATIQHTMNTLMKNQHNINILVIDQISKEATITMQFSLNE